MSRRHPHRARDPRAISTGTRTRVMERDGFRCRRCGAGPQDARLVVDHVVPVAKGGTGDVANLQTLCHRCNAGKAARDPHPHDLGLALASTSCEPPRQYQPHPDSCRACRDRYDDFTPHYARTITSETDGGFTAFYRCQRGHTWVTWWGWGTEIDNPERNPIPGRPQHFDGSFSKRAGVEPYAYAGIA